MGLRFFNTLSRSVQEFVPLDPAGKEVGMYCCGPTVYDFAHIGNWRTFVFADLVRRYLEFKGYQVRHVMNITDVEDKIIKRVRETNSTLAEFTGKYEAAFFEDLQTLNCRPPHQTPRATGHIPEIIALVEKLLARGIAYKTPDGSVYFSIEKYRNRGGNYGRLMKLNFDAMRVGERVASDEYEKESVADFALWKARVPEDGEVFWKSDSLGEGRPGWHIECSAMSMKALGETFDLHLGGEDLKFPHHEDEIAQSEGATGKPFVRYWLHGAFLLVEGRKMSKSLGNYFTLRDLLAKGFSGREIRYLLLTAHYRETFNFTMDGLQGARTALARIDECVGKLSELSAIGPECLNGTPLQTSEGGGVNLLTRFTKAMDDDLNISAALGVVFEWVRDTNRMLAANAITKGTAASALTHWDRINGVLGLGTIVNATFSAGGKSMAAFIGSTVVGGIELPSDIADLFAARQAARQAKDFKRADALRDELKAKGWIIEDTPKGPKLKKA